MAGFLHQLKTPLHVIQSQVELLMEDTSLPESVKTVLRMVLQNTERAAEQTRSLLSWTRGDGASLQRRSLKDMVEQICDFTASECRRRNIAIQKDLQDVTPILMDFVPLQGALHNFVANAVESMPQGGTLRIWTFEEPLRRRVGVIIEDSGPGMSRERLAAIQRPFQTSKQNGNGLGVYIAKHILQRHRATVHWESREGKGTTVTIRFPLGQR